ncbi:MAG: signal peptidase I [Gemmatimonadetes bacterium]|nr:signal peptidase I [Gemmatimonadota bacterium]
MQIISSSIKLARDWLRFAFFTLLLFFVVRGFLLEAFSIPTSSMEGTLLVGDFLFVNKALYGAEIPGTEARLPAIRDPARGDVVVFRPPHDRDRVYVKRVVGIAGDTLEMKEKTLFLNGAPREEPYARYLDGKGDAVHPRMKWQSDFLAASGTWGRYAPSRDTWGPIVVPNGRFFVLGDNRDNSEDSRYWGFIGREDIKGHPWMVYLSLNAEDGGSRGWLKRVRWDRVGRLVR